MALEWFSADGDLFPDDEEANYSNNIITLDNYDQFPLSELQNIKNIYLRMKILSSYYKFLMSIPKYKHVSEGKSIIQLMNEVERDELDNTSEIFFPSQYILVYYNKKRHYHSSKRRICHFCSEVIEPGQLYIPYRPLLYNPITGEAFVLEKSIILKDECCHYIPANIRELEQIQINIDNSYITSKSYDPDEYNQLFPNNTSDNSNLVDFKEAYGNTGGGLSFIKLRR